MGAAAVFAAATFAVIRAHEATITEIVSEASLTTAFTDLVLGVGGGLMLLVAFAFVAYTYRKREELKDDLE